MLVKLWQLLFVFTYSSACVFGAKNTISKRAVVPWHEERDNHTGLGISDSELEIVAQLQDEDHFNAMLTAILIPRVVGTPGHTSVRNFIINQLDGLGWTVETHSFDDTTPHGVKTFTNVIATLNPSAKRRLVLACHYDSKLAPSGFLGATDSAVPCAMLINLAHTLQGPLGSLKNKNPNLSLQLVFFDGEEAFVSWTSTDSIYGSRRLANDLQAVPFPPGNTDRTTQLNRIDLFVLLDLIGTKDCKFYSFFEESEKWYSRLASFEKRLLKKRLINRINRKITMLRDRSYYGSNIEDDHIPFLEKGVPILHLISAPFPSVWHNIGDNRNALHFPSIENLNTMMRAFVVDYLHLSL